MRHPLARRVPIATHRVGRGAGQPDSQPTRLQRAAALVPDVPRLILQAPRYPETAGQDPTGGMTKDEATTAFRTWLSSLPPTDTIIFSDGSELTEDGRHGVGYGYAVYRAGQNIATGQGGLHTTSHVFDAEAVGALRGLEAAIALDDNPPGTRFWVCIDNTAVIRGAQGQPADSSQWAFLAIHRLVDTHRIQIRWCPGHCDIDGNELADTLAKGGARDGPPDQRAGTEPTLSGARSCGRQSNIDNAAAWWEQAQSKLKPQYTKWDLPYRIHCPPELRLPRPVLHLLIAERTGHGDFADYHMRFHPQGDFDPNCACGSPKAPGHLVQCPITADRWRAQAALHRLPRIPRNPAQRGGFLRRLLSQPPFFQLLVGCSPLLPR